MRIVGRCNVYHVHIRIGKHFLKIIIHFLDPILLSKRNSFRVRAVAHRINVASTLCQRSRHLICNHTCPKNRPLNLCHKFSLSFESSMYVVASVTTDTATSVTAVTEYSHHFPILHINFTGISTIVILADILYL